MEDAKGGNGGREMLQALRNAFQCVHPDEGGFKNVNDYLRFRRSNVGAESVNPIQRLYSQIVLTISG